MQAHVLFNNAESILTVKRVVMVCLLFVPLKLIFVDFAFKYSILKDFYLFLTANSVNNGARISMRPFKI